MDTGLHTRTGLRVRVSRARVRVSKLLPIGKPAPVMRGCGFGRRSFKKLVIDIFFSVFVVKRQQCGHGHPLPRKCEPGWLFFSEYEGGTRTIHEYECLVSSMMTPYVLFCCSFFFTNYFFFLSTSRRRRRRR